MAGIHPAPPRDLVQAGLSPADDRVRLNHWLPPQAGVVPRIRIGQHWINVLWTLPLGFVLLVMGVAIAQALRQVPAVQEFLIRYPGAPLSAVAVVTGFPAWLRLQHFLNLFFMAFIIRAGLQILADHPRLYWKRDCTPGTEWFRFQTAVPAGRVWTAKDDSVTLPAWLGIPGIRHSIGLARWWHFSITLLWMVNGIVFYALLFTTGQWLRLVPTTWEVIPNAASTALQYLSLTFPTDHSWLRYNSLQQITYSITVFVAAPISILTGFMQSPAISNRLGWVGRALNRQRARSIHFIALCWFLFYILAHVTLVFITGARVNLNMMFAGTNGDSWSGVLVFVPAMALVAVTWWLASPFTLRHARLVQRIGGFLARPFNSVTQWWDPTSQLTEQDISPYFWPNGTMPASDEFDQLVKDGFAHYRLRIDGLVAKPVELTYAELKAMPKQEQITTHFCIQGWSGVARWGGVPMRHLLDLVKPAADARYAVFYSLADGGDGGRYYDVHSIANMRHELTMLAYEMNGAPLSVLHGAPLRLRCENELGFKMVKWIAAVEFVHDFSDLGAGEGGYNEDHEFYGYRVPI
ncbi:molybdopterin-binding oxidoreductase [Caballeronia arationis]|jgi:DMSO/TMAO reductase YedYZ molybdopterin-dependent catalytic subunit/thiosulfate reductase cytochrome b subunit|uniref:molybdopterin-dependent oxidoreductase n=1 Tax=Caballeronia arationis TaxID=1777142 RepID=UPI00074B6272|nr:molybdopterin-dependent oxidoreductase [Caballeronia arationis]SAK87424.1 molybdopterin-binding oxidoreductase [Caballeronia arationis]